MRAKHIATHLNLRARARLVRARITFSRLTTAYFVLAIIHCLVQVTIQSQAFAVNSSAASGLFNLLETAGDADEIKGFAIFDKTHLRICYNLVKTVSDDSSCEVVWPPQVISNSTGGGSFLVSSNSNSSTTTSPLPSPNSIAPQFVNSSALPTVTSPVSTTTAVAQTSSAQIASSPVAIIQSSSPEVASAVVALSSSSSAEVATVTSTPAPPPKVVIAFTPSAGGDPTTVVVPPAKSTHRIDADSDDDSDSDDASILSNIVQKLTGSSKRDLNVTKFMTNDSFFVNITGLTSDSVKGVSQSSAVLSDICIKTLLYPAQQLSNTRREDVTLIGFQVSVLGMSIVALLNESIPHVLAALFTQLVATIWTVFQVLQTEDFRHDFFRLTVNGACPGNNLLGSYWQERRKAQIASAVLNTVSFLITAFLTYKLTRIYGWQTFKRVGASIKINRMYKLVLSHSIAVQLSLFFIVAAAALWIDQLCNGSVGRLTNHGKAYKIGIIIIFVFLVPWLTLGWFAIRREMRKAFLAFLGLSLVFIGLWATMFDSIAFRWTFLLWPFFAVMAIVSGALMVLTLILGLACRFNFGKGLPHYLNSEELLDGNDFAPVYPSGDEGDPEKVDYPSTERPVPTFSVAFGRGDSTRRPADMHFGPSHNAERVVHQQSELANPAMRSLSTTSSMVPEVHLARSDSQTTTTSNSTDWTVDSDNNRVRRWMIE